MPLTFALQALLDRHESYMAEAEKERSRMCVSIDKLEKEKQELEAANARMVEENKGLLDHLEGLNSNVAESDAHLKSLTATLHSAQFEVRRLTVLASRTAQLEAQLAAMENEQAQQQQELVVTQEDERSAIQRWKQAECILRDLQDQVEKIEREARDEREKHVELIGRMERKRAVEKKLDSAAARLKGAAVAISLGRDKNGTSVVSHFVRDILQDNANLQIGIVELREMLQSSNEEVQNLRERILEHQPLENEGLERKTPLSQELDGSTTGDQAPQVSKELHVHHHYHAPSATTAPRKEKLPLYRRPKKKRSILPVEALTSSSGPQTPRTPTSRYLQRSPSSSATILSQTSVSIPPPQTTSHRWSIQSSATGSSTAISSTPSSPQYSSIFDRIDRGCDSSRPTSPESNSLGSPNLTARQRKGLSDLSFRSISEPAVFQNLTSINTIGNGFTANDLIDTKVSAAPKDIQQTEDLDLFPTSHSTILEEHEDECFEPNPSVTNSDTEFNRALDMFSPSQPPSSLRRSTSHESLLSISGMDIHIPSLLNRPPQNLAAQGGFSPFTPFTISSPTTALSSSKPVLSASHVTANPIQSRPASKGSSSQSLLSTVAAIKAPPPPEEKGFSIRVGGWFQGCWGIAPMASTGNLRAQATLNAAEQAGRREHVGSVEVKEKWKFRSVGINQNGPIRGLRPPARTASSVHARVIDERLLRESLAEE